MSEAQSTWFRETISSIRTELGKVIVGQDDIITGVLVGLATNGHVLLEGMPGLGKTLLVRSLADALSLSFSRIQFTPDLMPADVTGTQILQQNTFEFRPGPIFANLILADEINRATPKTQSAMLEAMQERTVTVGGNQRKLDEPFLVMATQNPIEQEGTYPLPEAQLDRFLLKLLVPAPSQADLAEIVNRTTGTLTQACSAVAHKEDVLRMRSIVRDVPISKSVLDYALAFVVGSHPESDMAPEMVRQYVRAGSSPRGAQALVSVGKVLALAAGRYNVSKEDIDLASKPVLRHRLILNFDAEADRVKPDQIIDALVTAAEKRYPDPVAV